MTADVELLPLPEADGFMESFDTYGCPVGTEDAWAEETVKDYARANLAPLQAEIEALRAEVELLRRGIVPRDDDMIVPVKLLDEINASGAEWKDRAERLAEALREWWAAHRPLGWTEDQHLACPHVNLATDTGKALADALLREQEEGRYE